MPAEGKSAYNEALHFHTAMFKEAKHQKEADALVRYEPEIAVGLKEEEVLAREKAGLSNKSNVRVDKPYWKIFTDNIFTVFNITLYAIGLLFLITSLLLRHFGHDEVVAKYFGISKYGFLGPATFNIIIGIIQECRSKRVLEKLRLVAEAKAHVIRDGKEQDRDRDPGGNLQDAVRTSEHQRREGGLR